MGCIMSSQNSLGRVHPYNISFDHRGCLWRFLFRILCERIIWIVWIIWIVEDDYSLSSRSISSFMGLPENGSEQFDWTMYQISFQSARASRR